MLVLNLRHSGLVLLGAHDRPSGQLHLVQFFIVILHQPYLLSSVDSFQLVLRRVRLATFLRLHLLSRLRFPLLLAELVCLAADAVCGWNEEAVEGLFELAFVMEHGLVFLVPVHQDCELLRVRIVDWLLVDEVVYAEMTYDRFILHHFNYC